MRNHLKNGSDTIDDNAKDGGPEVIWQLCSFYQDPLQSLLLCLVSYKPNIHRTASNGFTSLYPQCETNLMSNYRVIELPLQLKSAKAHGKNYIKVKPPLVRHLLCNRVFVKFLPWFLARSKISNINNIVILWHIWGLFQGKWG